MEPLMNNIHKYLDQTTKKNNVNKVNHLDSINQVEIVIPIFNGFQIVSSCIAKLLRHTSSEIKITLLDDASTDTKLTEYLYELPQKHPQIQLITREHNLGYLQNINSYLENNQHTIVLLNSDTEVTEGWLEAMLRVASDSRIGIVCPLSDNATILSLPDINPLHITQLQQLSDFWFPIPTAVGFCMLIKPNIWKELQGFDPYYDPGYGEECDFSMLVRQRGLQIACAPAAYVYHQGSQSFKKQSLKLQQQHQDLLDLRWPSFNNEIQQFNLTNPIIYIKQWLQKQASSKPRLLHILHGIDNKGGVELFTKSLIESFDQNFHHTLLVKSRNKTSMVKSSLDIIEINMGGFNPEHIIFNLPADLYNQNLDMHFKSLLQWGGFQMVHFHSMVGIGTAIWPQICFKLGIPYAMFFHDHSGLCQIFCLTRSLKQEEVYCGKPFSESKSKQCVQCIQDKTKRTRLTTQSYINLRAKIWNENIQNANHLQFCSNYLVKLYQHKYPDILSKSTILTPCFYESQTTPTSQLGNLKANIAFLGQFGVLKGAQLYIDLYHQMSAQNIEWQIIGGVDPIYNYQLEQTRIIKRGPYQSADLPRVLKGVDIIVFTTQMPETYGITLTEAMVNGIPVVAPNIGAYPSRIKNNKNGILYQANDLVDLVSKVLQMIDLQRSNKRIKQIEYTASHGDPNIKLSKLYGKSIKQNKFNFLSECNKETLLENPKSDAFQVMQKWLDAPMTLEAEADWKSAPIGLNVLILGTNKELIQETTNNLNEHLINPIIIVSNSLSSKHVCNKKLILVITAGTLTNENIGNWVVFFSQHKALACIADFALHNHQNHTYAPQFLGKFSWQNISNNGKNMSCMLLKPQSVHQLAQQNLNFSQSGISNLLDHLYQHHPDQVTHFPFFTYSMPDQQFVTQWKKREQIILKINKQPNKKIMVLVETHLTGKALQKLKQQHHNQFWKNSLTVQTLFISAIDKTELINSYDFSDSVVFIMADNIRFTDNYCLQTMLEALHINSFDVLTIPAARGVTGQYLVAKKTGSANHFAGIGQIKDMRFNHPKSVYEHEWLDDDFWLFNNNAWELINKIYQQDNSLFTALKISNQLQKNNLTIGISATDRITKQGLPSYNKYKLLKPLNEQREKVISDAYHLPVFSHYPKAFSCKGSSQLELNNIAFKTPKTLPRVIAYAQDDWASGFYRVKSPLNALAADNRISIHFLANDSLPSTPTPYEIHRMEADVLLLHGFYADHQLAALNQYKKQLNIPVVISIDDLLTDIPAYNPFSKTIPSDIRTRIKLACSLADGLIVSSSELAKHFNPYHSNISVIPNRLSHQVWSNKPKVNFKQDRLRVGWAGAGQHEADLDWLINVVKQSKSFCDWVFFGDQPTHLEQDLFEFHQPVNILQYPAKLKSLKLDLGVAPLIDNPFNRAKSSLKLIEYGVLGLPVIASDLPCYQHSPAILLKNDIQLWINQLQAFNRNRNLLAKNGQDMWKWVEQGYWLEDHQSQWLKALGLS